MGSADDRIHLSHTTSEVDKSRTWKNHSHVRFFQKVPVIMPCFVYFINYCSFTDGNKDGQTSLGAGVWPSG